MTNNRYTELIEEINQRKRELFRKLKNKSLSLEDFCAACQELDKKLETSYHGFLATEKMFLDGKEIEEEMKNSDLLVSWSQQN